MATVSETGWPYVQHRGGSPGFLKVVDPKTLSFTDMPGNRQFISVGNLAHNDRVALILVDYAHRQRLKILGRLSVRETVGGARPQREMTIQVEGFDWNCPQHIPVRIEAELARAQRVEYRTLPRFGGEVGTLGVRTRSIADLILLRKSRRTGLKGAPDGRVAEGSCNALPCSATDR